MTKRLFNLIFLITFIFTIPSMGQSSSYSIKGTVFDAETGESAPFVYIHLEEINRTTVSTVDGDFELKNIPLGTYTFTAHRIGYRTQSQKVTISDSDLTLTIKLKTSVFTSDAVEVIGARSGVSGSNLEHASKTISGADLRRSLSSTLSQTLSSIPGFDQRTQGAAPGRPVIRGLGGERVVILQDGISSGDISAQSSDHAVTIDPGTAEEIEIARGPAALAFGANAIGGVINVVKNQIPTSVPSKINGSFTLSGQSVNSGVSGALSTAIPLGNFAVQADLSGLLSGDTQTPLGKIANSSYKTTNDAIGISYSRPWGYSGVSASIYSSHYGIPPDPNGHVGGVDIEMMKIQYDSKSEIIINRNFLKLLEIDVSFKDYEHKEIEGKDADGHAVIGTLFNLRTSNADVRLKHNPVGIIKDGSLGISAQFEDYAVEGTGTPPASNLGFGTYLIEETDLGNMHLEMGLRFDVVQAMTNSTDTFYPIGVQTGAVDSTSYKDRTFSALSGSVAAIYAFGDGFSAGASILRSFRAPSMEELYSEGPHLASYSYEIGNPDLDPERAWAKEIFVGYKTNSFNVEAAVFHNSFDNYLYARNTGRANALRADLLDYQFTGTKAWLYGFELSGEAKLTKRFVGQFSISQTTAEQEVMEPSGSTIKKPLPQVPPLKAQASLKYTHNFFEVGTQLKHAIKQDRIGEFETTTDAYSTVDIFSQYRFESNKLLHSISFNINNLLNTAYYNHLSRIKDLVPEPGRNFNLLYRVYF
ncbi:MAG: TonB-dependent receptor [Balneolaceae bacterium]